MRTTAILIAALAGMLGGTHAQAQEPGGYLGIGYSAVWSRGGSFYGDTLNEDVSSGGKVFGGYQWGRMAAELSYNDLGTYDIAFGGAKIAQLKTSAISIAGIYSWPLAQGYTVGVKAGIAFTKAKHSCVSLCGVGDPQNVDTQKRGVSGLIGLGLAMGLSENIAIRIDFDHFGDVKHAIDLTEYNEPYDVMSISLKLSF